MTFIIGWKSQAHAFLCADSAFTTFNGNAPTAPMTSFGEAIVCKPDLQVQESGLKLVNLGRVVVAMAGDYSTAKRILLTLADELRHVEDIPAALATSIGEVVGSEKARDVSLILAAPTKTGPVLLAYDSATALYDIHSVDDGMGVSYGSLEGAPREQARTLIGAFMGLEPAAQLHCALGVLQALGINSNLLELRVGGAFCGVCVDTSSIRWQGDTLYIVHQPGGYWCKQVCTVLRANALFVESAFTETTKVFVDNLAGGITDYHRDEAIEELRDVIVGCKYDYVVFLTAGIPVSVVVEMNKKQQSKHLRFPSSALADLPGDVPLHFQLQVSRELTSTIAGARNNIESPEPVTRSCFFFPYQPVPGGDTVVGAVVPISPRSA